jgi:hypothetical protein
MPGFKLSHKSRLVSTEPDGNQSLIADCYK